MAGHVVAYISKEALAHNLQQVKCYAPGAKVLAMVKANAYGHGLVRAAHALSEADALGVARIEEALLLRQAGVRTPIVLIEGIFRKEELRWVQTHRLVMVVHHWDQIAALQSFSQPLLAPFEVWLKINIGMNRLGFSPSVFAEAYQALCRSGVTLLGFMGHFSHADERQNQTTLRQWETFLHVVGERPGLKCVANSAAILSWPQGHADWVRPGLILYGVSPFSDTLGRDHQLRPAMSFQAEIIAIQTVSKQATVGYSGTWENPRAESRIGIVCVGYGDGYPWQAQNGTPVWVNGQRVPLVGRVSMDMLAIDITEIDAKVGDRVILWGDPLPVEEVARAIGTLPYELLCRLQSRVKTAYTCTL